MSAASYKMNPGFGRCYLVSTRHEILSNIDRNQVRGEDNVLPISMCFIDMLSCLKSKIEVYVKKA